jgi:leader peptidase (prepilin peptidase)/N-methyltransferase
VIQGLVAAGSTIGAVGAAPAGVTVVAATAAGLAVRASAHEAHTRRLWWVASGLALVAAVAAAGHPVPVAAGLAGAGLAAAAVVDASEGRIPTPVAHGTTAVSLVLMAADALVTGDWAPLGRAVGLTAGLVAVFTVLWLAGGMGFGDVRLAAATVTASTAGVPGLVALVWGAFLTAGALVAGRRIVRRHRGSVPFGPSLAAGWLLAVTIT